VETPPIMCACGCGQPIKRRRYPSQGQPRFLQGHQHKGANNGNYRGGKTMYACAVCGKTFYEWASQPHRTCGDPACYAQWQRLTTTARGRNTTVVTCDYCGKTLLRFPSQVRERNYCNRFCQFQGQGSIISGFNNGNWRGGSTRYFMLQASIRDGHRRVVCGFDLAVDVHHVTPRSKGGTDDLSNLLTLCPNHHRLAHRGIIDLESYRRTDWTPEGAARAEPASR
jgi:5-methylcytosine-specific restriction endonuclease McrA